MNNFIKSLMYIIGGIFVFFSLKGCISYTWESHEKPVSYSARDSDNREMAMIFLPNMETIFVYDDPTLNYTECVLTKMRGSYGTHYVGPLWKIDGPKSGGLLGFKWMPKGHKPIHMEIIHLDKLVVGQGPQIFGDVKDTIYTVITKDTEKNRFQFKGIWLDKTNYDPEQISAIRSKFKKVSN